MVALEATRWMPMRLNIRNTLKHRQVDPVGGQRAESGEVRLVLELKSPRERPFEVDSVARSQIVLSAKLAAV